MDDPEHRAWLKRVRHDLSAIIEGVSERPHSFSCLMRGYCGSRVGYVGRYATARDLTASILHWYLDHEMGEVPAFYLGDAIQAAGPLWDETVASDVVWLHLKAA